MFPNLPVVTCSYALKLAEWVHENVPVQKEAWMHVHPSSACSGVVLLFLHFKYSLTVPQLFTSCSGKVPPLLLKRFNRELCFYFATSGFVATDFFHFHITGKTKTFAGFWTTFDLPKFHMANF